MTTLAVQEGAAHGSQPAVAEQTPLEQAWTEYLRDDESEAEICNARGSTDEEKLAAQRRSEASFARAEALAPRPWSPS